MEVLLQSEGLSRESCESLFSSGFSTAGFQGSISMVNLDKAWGRTLDQPMCRSLDVDETIDEDIEEASLRRPEKKRRLSTDQVQFLERCFELDNKLEHERKIQLAKELGLQPRQVAIWFQNRRARWKTKMLEKDYEALKSSYDRLMADHEQLVKEKEKLKAEFTVLTGKFLLREAKGNPETTELNNVVIKEEDGRSGDSVIFDAESFNCIGEGLSPLLDPSISSNTLDPDQSGLSHAEDGEVKDCSLLRLEETTHNSCSYEFLAEDPALWFWSY